MDLAQLLESAESQLPVAGLTHSFYRYPARFSPQFARSAIEAFTNPMDTVMDPFMGGGTTAVEALSLGRPFWGSDINPLSIFLARAKTTPLSVRDERAVLEWAISLERNAAIRLWHDNEAEWQAYQLNTPWWIRRAIGLALDFARNTLGNRRQQDFARSIVLRTAQWCLDCKDVVPSSTQFFGSVATNAAEMISAARAFRGQLAHAFGEPPSRCLRFRRFTHCDAADVSRLDIPKSWLPPKLILTSPPYFGVHILYHRWQVQGRRETPAPFWIAASKDGMGAAYYTFGARQRKKMDGYLRKLQTCFASIAAVMGPKSTLVQLVAFADASTQLDPYLETLRNVGLKEVQLAQQDGRFWRTVPNRKWYSKVRGGTPASKELLLIHRLG